MSEQGDIVDRMGALGATLLAAARPHTAPVVACPSQSACALIGATAGHFANYGIR